MRTSWLRIGLGLVSACVLAVPSMVGTTLHARATGSLTITPASIGGGTCHNLNPDLEINTTALTAVADNTRGYTQISSVSVGAGPSIDGIAQAAITFNLCGAVPSFPQTNGDTGVTYLTCFSPSAEEPIVSGRFGAVLGNDPVTGNPIFDGPYPKSQGFRFCAWADINARAGVDYGVAIYDPIGEFVFRDPATMFDGTLANPTISKATLAAGATSFTMYLPYIWRQTANGGLPIQVVESEQVLSSADALASTDWVAESRVSSGIGLPVPVCAPTTSICVQGILDESVPVDFAPGYEACSAPLEGCTQYEPLGFDMGVENDFPISSIMTCINPVNPPGNNPTSPAMTCDVDTGVNARGLPYVRIFIYGRILPGRIIPLVSPVGSGSIGPFGQFIDDGLNFAA